MKTRRSIVALVLLAFVACAPKTLTPRGQALYTSITFVDALHGLQSAAIDANRLGALSDTDSVAIVKFTRASALTVQQAPEGWRPTVITGWDELSKVVPPERVAKSATLRILWTAVAATIEELRKAGRS